jgi:CspA family cold shock protein
VHGVVNAFDGHVGRGVVRGDDGTDYGFHCVAIADGTRQIAVGTAVDFDVTPGPLGRWEATQIRPQ